MQDTAEMLRLIRRAEKSDIYANANKTIKVAFVGKNSIQYIAKAVRYLVYEKYEIAMQIYEGDYDGIEKNLLDKQSDYYTFFPDVTVILPDHQMTDINFYTNLWRGLPGAILQSNFVVPPLSALGNLEMNLPDSENFKIAEANLELVRQKPRSVTILDFDGLASRMGKDRWFDYPAYFTTKQGFCLDFLEEAGMLIARQIGVLCGCTRKCLVLDLDNTLWGGVVGDDGCDGIQLDPNDPVGESYRFFQQYVLALKNRGVLLAICSKNEMTAAQEPFERNPNMLLRLSDIACFVANWEDKAQNLPKIAEQLNIGIDSLVFFDDNPAERERVHNVLPQVEVIDVPNDPAFYAKALSDSGVFDWIQLTDEDRNRASTYLSNQKREVLRNQYEDYETYLSALEMKCSIDFLDEKRVPRFTQLINKTNQFNLRTQRYTENQIETMLHDPQYKLIYAELSDKFDQYGLISCVIIKQNFIDTWVMSCRVFKRHIEDKMMQFIFAHTDGNLYGEYLATPKNALVKDLYSQMGFQRTEKEGVYIYERV